MVATVVLSVILVGLFGVAVWRMVLTHAGGPCVGCTGQCASCRERKTK